MNSINRYKQIKHTKTPSGANISVFAYTYGTGTEFGQIKTLARTLPESGGTTWTTTTQTFTHDVIGQLKQSAETGLPTRTYTYDVAGNRKTKSEGGVSTSYGPANTVNQITSATGGTDAYSSATSDANGSLTQIVYSNGSRRVMTWDSINRLKRIEIRAGINPAYGDKATDFTYNGLSQRTQNTNWTHTGTSWSSVTYDWFVWGDGEIVQKRAGSTSFTNGTNYYAEGESRHTGTSSTKYYYTRDHLGTVYEMTNWSGTAQAAYTYGPYGDRTKRYGSYETEKAYTGHWVYKPSAATHAAAKQLYLSWYRVYDPQAGRWLSRDPIGEAGGLNLYGYVGNNPIEYIDPTGEISIFHALVAVVAVAVVVRQILRFTNAGKKAINNDRFHKRWERFVDDPTPENATRAREARQECIEDTTDAAEAGADVGGTGMRGPATPPTNQAKAVGSAANMGMEAIFGP